MYFYTLQGIYLLVLKSQAEFVQNIFEATLKTEIK